MRRRIVSTLCPALLWAFAAAGPALAQEQPPTQIAPATPEPAPGQLVDVAGIALAVDGKAVDAAPPGVTVSLTITLRNDGTEPLANVRASLLEPQDGVHLIDKDATYGSMAPGKTADGAFSFSVDKDTCTDFLGLGAEVTYDGGSTPQKIGVPAACPGPRLGVQNAVFEGGDGDGAPEPGETLKMFIILGNEGNDPATNVHASIKVGGEGVTASNTALAWPDIAAKGSAQSLTPVIVTIAGDAPTQKGCQGFGGGTPVPIDIGTVRPDQAVASDGTTSSSGGGGSSTGSGSSANTGSTPGSEPGSPGTGEPVIVDPAPPPPGTPKPAPDASTEPGGTVTAEPVPNPIPPSGSPEPQPAPQDDSVLVTVTMAVDATGYHVDLEYSNQVACALEGGVRDDKAFAPQLAARTGGTSSQGGAAFPVAVAIVASAAAVGARKVFAR